MKMINRMKIFRLLPLCLLLFVSCNNEKDRTITLDKSVLLDKIAGGLMGREEGGELFFSYMYYSITVCPGR